MAALEKKGGAYAIIVRGTVDTPGSVVEDLLSLLIKAEGAVVVGSFSYKFSDQPGAAVHLGFALGALLILKTPSDGVFDKLAELKVPSGPRSMSPATARAPRWRRSTSLRRA